MGNASIILLPEVDWQQLLVFHQIYFKMFHVVKTCNIVLLSSQPPFGDKGFSTVIIPIKWPPGKDIISILLKLKKFTFLRES